MPVRLPIVDDSPGDADDPLAAVRGGRAGRRFLLLLLMVGLWWVGSQRLEARDLGPSRTLVHTQLGFTPPMPKVEELPSRDTEGVSPEANPYGPRRTAEGALVLETSEPSDEDAEGVSDETRAQLDQGGFFDPEAFDDARKVERKAYVHLMPGIPNGVFFAASGLILLLSFVAFERYGERRDPRGFERNYWRLELTRWPWLRRAMKSRWFQPAVQLPVAIVFGAVIVAGLVGSQAPGRNIAPVLTWNIWWIGLIFMVLLFGNLWCFMCPWTAIPDWVMRGSLWRVTSIRSLAKKYPRFRLWMWPAILLFAWVTWLEIVYDAANRPWLTSLMGIGMVVLAWALLVVFERKAMCRYVCFVGRVSGQYAMMGMLELRRRDHERCRTCATKDCFHGREDAGYPCPTHEFMGAMNENQYCTLCTECVKSCPHDNVALNLRTSGADLLHRHRAKRDEAYLALLIFVVSAFHGAAMVPLWMEGEGWVRGKFAAAEAAALGHSYVFDGSHGGTVTFTLMMLTCIFVPVGGWALLCALMRLASGRADVSRRRLFVRLAYTLLPIALFYHLAHNATHVFYEWSKLWRLLSDPLGWGWDLFGTARAPLSTLLSPESIWYLQVGLVLVGHVYGIFVAQREVFRVYDGDRKAAFRVHLVMLVGMVLLSLLSLWLLAQPMFMRTATVS